MTCPECEELSKYSDFVCDECWHKIVEAVHIVERHPRLVKQPLFNNLREMIIRDHEQRPSKL